MQHSSMEIDPGVTACILHLRLTFDLRTTVLDALVIAFAVSFAPEVFAQPLRATVSYVVSLLPFAEGVVHFIF